MRHPRQQYSRPARHFALLLVLTAMLSACQYAYRQPEVTSGDARYDIRFPVGSATLGADSASGVRDFVASLAADGGTYTRQDIYVVGGAAIGSSGAQATRLIDERNAAVARELATIGTVVRSGPPRMPVTPIPPDTVAVVVERTLVTLPACPDWSGSPNFTTYSNQPMSNWSCATAVNLGMMVVDPADLRRGRQPGVAEADPAARSIQLYREGKTKPLSTDVSTAEAYASDGSGSGGGSQ